MASKQLRFDGRVVLVTGAGNGLGKEYALAFGARGAKVIVNDLGGDIKGEGKSSRPADLVVDQIKSNGGVAIANYDSVEEGEKLIKTALDNFGRIDIIVNNAGILRDRSFARISDNDWGEIFKIPFPISIYHPEDSFAKRILDYSSSVATHEKSKLWQIITISSAAGIYGNFGQANYSAAKMGVIGLTKTIAIEGQKNNILCNVIAPMAGSRLTKTVMPDQLVDALKPEYVAPLVLWLSHEDSSETGSVYECGAGWVGKLRWQRSLGAVVRRKDVPMSPEDVRDNWDKISDFTDGNFPASIQEANTGYFSTLQMLDGKDDNARQSKRQISSNNTSAPSSGQSTGSKATVTNFSYTERDAILYALGVGVSTKQPDYLKFLFEMSDSFSVLPTYAVIPAMAAVGNSIMSGDFDGFKVNPAMILHGEQYVELFKPLEPNAKLTSKCYVADLLDKGSGAVIIANVDTFSEKGERVAFNQTIIFVQKAGGFGGKRSSDKAIALAEPPNRLPDASIQEKTAVDQAAIYRLSGDSNPLHIDPSFAALGGFSTPILHGLCSFGYAARHVLQQYCDNDVTKFKAIKVRFTSPVLPGETIRTDMWKEGSRIHFVCKVVETGKACLSGAYVDLNDGNSAATTVPPTGQANLESDGIFRAIIEQLRNDKSIVEVINATYLFKITKEGKVAGQWTVNLTKKDTGIYQGPPRDGTKADCILTLTDENLVGLASGKLNGTELFTTGKLKVEGNVMLALRLGSLFEQRSKL